MEDPETSLMGTTVKFFPLSNLLTYIGSNIYTPDSQTLARVFEFNIPWFLSSFSHHLARPKVQEQ